MNYWHIQMSQGLVDGIDKSANEVIEILKKYELIGTGEWKDKRNDQCNDFKNKMQIGDIVMVRAGKNPLALVKVLSESSSNIIFENSRKVQVLSYYSDLSNRMGPYNNAQTRGTLEVVSNLNTNTAKYIINWFNLINKNMETQKIIEILKYKQQIILQGPPGTGKTRMAKILAKEMTSPILSKNPLNIIEDFFKNYNNADTELIKKRQEIKSTLENFQSRFPISSLKDLSLDDYCVGKGNRNNFCWWIETGLKDLGRYSPGKSNHYLIYYSNSQGAYIKTGSLVKDIDDDNEAMKRLASVLYDAVSKKDFENGSKYFGDSFLLKIFNSYYPDEYFPINGRDYLDNALTIFGVDSQNLNKDKKNLRLNEEFNKLKSKYMKDVNSFEFMSFLFKTFNLKEGIDTIEDHKIINKGESKLIQFHPAYTYEDFVRGITAKPNAKSQVEYKVEDKILAQFAQRALDNPSANYVLIIDEINRANLPSVLGELIYALEYRFNPKEPEEKESTVDSIYSIADPDGSSESYEEGKKLKLPTNLYIIGTMNTADRSVGHIDYAIRRRFAFVDILPDKSVLTLPLAVECFEAIENLFEKHTASDFEKQHVLLGHSYFLADDNKKLKLKLKYEVLPILNEYLNDGVINKTEDSFQLLKEISDKIDGINE